eukprot:2367376-Pleurochrysis_carterae.AAC.1
MSLYSSVSCMRGEYSQVEREMRVPRRARLAEVKSAGLLPPMLVDVRGPWRRELRCVQASQRNEEASGGGSQEREGRGSGRG